MRKDLQAYITGFIFSVSLTLTAYFAATGNLLPGQLPAIVVGLALIQLWVQLTFFLHLGQRSARENLAIVLTTASVMFILIAGSLWIMHNLNYHTAPIPSDQEIIQDEGLYK